MGFLNLTRLITLIAVLVAALALPALATADGDDVIRDCARDGDLDKEYSDEELEEASENMPSDVDAYSNCREVIRQAQAGGGSGDGGNRGGATASDISELERRQQEAKEGTAPAAPAELAAGADAEDDSGLPTPALVAIILLALAAIGGGVYLLRDQLPPGLTSRFPGTSR
jgi:hypothetical protein